MRNILAKKLFSCLSYSNVCTFTLFSPVGNTQIYNLSSGPHITCFLAVVAKKRKNFE